MILDSQLIFSENQAITATAISFNVVQLLPMGTVAGNSAPLSPRNLGAGNELPLLIQVTQTFNNLTSLTITLETSAAAGLTSPTVLYTSGAVPLAQLVAGYRPAMRWFPDASLLGFIGLRYTVTGTAPTAGAITAALAVEI